LLGLLVDFFGARIVPLISILTALPLVIFLIRFSLEDIGNGNYGAINKASESEPDYREEKRNNPSKLTLSDSESSATIEELPAPLLGQSSEVTVEAFKNWRRNKSVTVGRVCHIIFQSRSSLAFFSVQFVIGGGMQVVQNMLFIFLAHKFGASGFIMGLSVGMTVLFEIPIFHFTEAITLRFGCTWMLIIGQLAFVVRVFGYTLVSGPVMILFLEPLHGITYGLIQSASVLLVSKLAEPGLESTAQTLTTTFRGGAGPAAFLLFSGYQMDKHGGDSMFIACGFAVLISTVVYAFVSRNENITQQRPVYRTVVELHTQESENS